MTHRRRASAPPDAPAALDAPGPGTQPTGRLLLQAFRSFEAEVLRGLAAAGYADVTLGHLNVLRHLDNEGLSITALARDAAMSKQATGRTVRELERRGYLTVTPDAYDARALHVGYTPRGRTMIAAAVEYIRGIEQSWLAELGPRRHAALRDSLERLIGLKAGDKP